MKERKLTDRIETYSDIITGKCMCGMLINKVLNSSCSMWENGDRYYYPLDITPVNEFRCVCCERVISKSFIPDNNMNSETAARLLEELSDVQPPELRMLKVERIMKIFEK